MISTGSRWPTTFKAKFCESFGCSSSQYEELVFWKCLYRHALPFAIWMRRSRPDFFREDFDLIREVGDMDDPDLFRGEVNFFHGRVIREKSRLRKTFGMRVSAQRLMKLKEELFRNPLLALTLHRQV